MPHPPALAERIDVAPGASPMTVWEGSHEIMREAFARRLDGIAPGRWQDEDITEAYVSARKECFARCTRITLRASRWWPSAAACCICLTL